MVSPAGDTLKLRVCFITTDRDVPVLGNVPWDTQCPQPVWSDHQETDGWDVTRGGVRTS